MNCTEPEPVSNRRKSRQYAHRVCIVLGKAAADDQHLICRLNDQRVNGAIGAVTEVDGGNHCATRQQPRDTMAGDAAGRGELAGQHDPVIGLQRDGLNGVIGANPDIVREDGVQRPVGIQAGDVVQATPLTLVKSPPMRMPPSL